MMEKLHDVVRWFTEHGYLIPFAGATLKSASDKVHWTRIAEGIIIAVIVGFIAGDRSERAQEKTTTQIKEYIDLKMVPMEDRLDNYKKDLDKFIDDMDDLHPRGNDERQTSILGKAGG